MQDRTTDTCRYCEFYQQAPSVDWGKHTAFHLAENSEMPESHIRPEHMGASSKANVRKLNARFRVSGAPLEGRQMGMQDKSKNSGSLGPQSPPTRGTHSTLSAKTRTILTKYRHRQTNSSTPLATAEARELFGRETMVLCPPREEPWKP